MFYPDKGYDTRWTDREMKHQDEENRDIQHDCPAQK